MKSSASSDTANSILALAGLSKEEGAFYTAALALGKAPVAKIAREAGLNRSSAYEILKALAAKGLVSKVRRLSGIVVTPTPPKRLLEIQKEQYSKLEAHVGQLQSIFAIAKSDPEVKYYEGKEGLKVVMDEILEEKGDVCIFGDGDAFAKCVPGWSKQYSFRRAALKIHARLLLKATPDTIGAAKYLRGDEVDEKKTYSKIRLLPEALGIFGGFDVYGKKVAFYSFEERNIAVVVESKMINAMMRSIFEMLWTMSEQYEKTLIR